VRAAEVVASRILFWGGVLSVLLMTLGIIGFAVRGGLSADFVAAARQLETQAEGKAPGVYTSLSEVGRALGRWPVDPLAIVTAGVLLLLATPFVGVVAVFVVFARAGDRRYAGLAAALIGALLVSFAFVSR
jgi:uncharacterized membrane protein